MAAKIVKHMSVLLLFLIYDSVLASDYLSSLVSGLEDPSNLSLSYLPLTLPFNSVSHYGYSSSFVVIDCEFPLGPQENSNNFLFLAVDTSLPVPLETNLCKHSTSNIKGVLIVNPQKFSLISLEEKEILVKNSLISFSLQFGLKIVITNKDPCIQNSFDAKTKACGPDNKRRLDNIQNYQDALNQAGTYAGAINLIYTSVQFDQALWNTMVNDLIQEAEHQLEVYPGGTVYLDFCDSNLINNAVVNLLSVSSFVTAAGAEGLFAILKYSLVQGLDYAGCPAAPGNFFDAHAAYLSYFRSNTIGYTAEFLTKLTNVDDNISNFGKILNENGQSFPNYSEAFQSGTFGTNIQISSKITVELGDSSLCTCSFCVSTSINIKVYNMYFGLGAEAAAVGLRYYVTGTVGQASNTYFDATLAQLTPDCFEYTYELPVYTQSLQQWACYPNTLDCSSFSVNSNSVSFKGKGFSVFQIYAGCADPFEINDTYMCKCKPATYPSSNTCTNCMAKCSECTNSLSCVKCSLNYLLNPDSNACSCSANQFEAASGCENCNSKCSACSSLTVCTACTSNYELINSVCECALGYYDTGSGCEKCNTKCVACNSPSTCTACISNYELNNLVCGCALGYFDTDSGCEQCNSRCSACSSLTVCTACTSNYELINSVCGCASGYYDAGSRCEKCNTKCSSCSSHSPCITCMSNYELNNLACICGTGYFDTGSGCEQCSTKCASCISLSACTACFSNYELKDSACGCNSGYYDAGTGCEKCNSKCSTCSSSTSCTACNSNYELSNAACTCSSGYFDTGSGCEQCKSKCSACESSTTCTACISNYELINSVCGCASGYYDSGSGCEKCNSKCSTCISSSSCITCTSNYELLSLMCACSSGYFDTGSLCEKCNSKCSACNSSFKCSACSSNYELNINDCICASGYYDAGTGCEKCNSKCSTCNSFSSCTACNSNYELNNAVCTCSSGYFDTASGCEQCKSKCSACESSTTCTACTGNYELINSVCGCASGYYDSGSGCEKCNSKCSTCISSSSCIACTSNYELLSLKCSCGSGYFDAGSRCEKCNPKCSACNSYSDCSSCSSNYEFNNNDCTCSSGYFDTGSGCEKCNVRCSVCSSLDSCSTCANNYNLNNGVCTCSSSYFDSGSSCVQCDTKCSSCSSASVCITCNSYYQLIDQACRCEDGKFDDGTECKACSLKCAKCENLSNCLECSGTYQKIAGGCGCSQGFYDSGTGCTKCDSRCAECSSAIACSQCNSNYITDGGLCGCNKGTFDSGTQCENCNSKCTACTALKVCTECLNSYTIVNDMCVCPDRFTDSGTECLPICNTECTCSEPDTCSECIREDYQKDEALQICRQARAFLQAHHIDSLLFDIQLTQLILTFKHEFTGNDMSTDCSLYFSDTSSLGTKPLCFVGSKFVLKIIFGQDWTIIENSSLNIIKGSILIPGSVLLLDAPDLSVVAKYPANFDPNPHPVISGPDSVSSGCGAVDIIYTSSRSYGVASDKFTYLWSVSGTNVQLTQSTFSSCILSVSSSPNDQTVILTLTISNFLGNSNSVTLNILIKAAPTISAILDYQDGTVVYRPAYTVVSVSIKSRCGFDIINANYLWTVTPALPSNPEVVLNQNRLRIREFTLQTETTYTLTLQISSATFATTQVSTTIYCKSSSLIALLDKTNQEIGTFNDLVINGGTSYDPDYPGTSGVNFQWNTNIPGADYSAVTSSALTIDKFTLQQFTSLTVTLTITSVNAPLRTGSLEITLLIKQDILINVSIKQLATKPRITDSPYFASQVDTNVPLSSLTYKWTQTLGKLVTIQPKLSGTCMQIPNKQVVGGAKYTFKLTVSTATTSSFTETSFTVNSPATCKGATISPNFGNQATEFQIMPLSCSDIDLDKPLYYTYYANSTVSVIIKAQSGDASFKTILPSSVKYVAVKVTDALLDGNTYSAAVSVSKTRHLKSYDVYQAYNKYRESEEIFVLISMMIQSHQVPSDLLDQMWGEFVEETKDLPPNRINVESILRIIRLFIDESQQESFNLEKIQKYMNYAVDRLKALEGNIDDDVWESIDQLLNRVLDISPEMEYSEMAFKLIKCVMDIEQTSNLDPVELKLERIVGLKSMGSVNSLRGKDIKILNSQVEIRSVEDFKDQVINVEIFAVAGGNSDILKIDIFHCKEIGWGRTCDATSIDYEKSEVVVMMPMWEQGLECERYSMGQRKKCEIIDKGKVFAHVKVVESGVYTMVAKNNEAESFAMVYLICFVSIAGICFVLAAIYWLRPSRKNQHKKSANIFSLKTGREIKSASD